MSRARRAVLALALFILPGGCASQSVPSFDSKSAYDYLVKQCDFGPRDPGSAGHEACREYLERTLRLFADFVRPQQFVLSFGRPRKSVTATNLIAQFRPEKPDRLLLCAHWDTRPWADRDPDPAAHNRPILGANDGASGTAVLLELARLMHQYAPPVGVDLVFFDGEDAGQYQDNRSWAKGSAHYARNLGAAVRPRFGVLVDLIGDADLVLPYELHSWQYARPLVQKVWDLAASLGLHQFRPEPGYAVYDDHLPLLEAGIQCIDIIDFDYPYWHTLEDTPDKCSAASLGAVGTVLAHLVYRGK